MSLGNGKAWGKVEKPGREKIDLTVLNHLLRLVVSSARPGRRRRSLHRRPLWHRLQPTTKHLHRRSQPHRPRPLLVSRRRHHARRQVTLPAGRHPSVRRSLRPASRSRLRLAEQPDAQYELLIVDAYSSEAPPLHLMTREALALYRRKLAPAGVAAFHISNRHVDLEPVLAALAADAGAQCLVRHEDEVSPDEAARGKFPSVWAVITDRPELRQAPKSRKGRA